MISSMTGFAYHNFETAWGTFSLNIRSVNHRYLELFIKLPELFRNLEPDIRKLLQTSLKRGKVELFLKFKPAENFPCEISINHSLVKQLSSAIQVVQKDFPHHQTDINGILNWPGVLSIEESNVEAIEPEILSHIQRAVETLVDTRCREGEELKQMIENTITSIESQRKEIEVAVPEMLEMQKQKILEHFEKLKLEVDQSRMEQELVWLIQKIDITEELDRLKTHLSETKRILNNGGQAGRRLDFLMQELNRETNTICSKSINTKITRAALEIKVFIEQIREQVQNIE